MTASRLLPQHHSMVDRTRLPNGMSRVRLPDEQRVFLDAHAIAIFTDCVNNGHTFQTALSALYLSGLENGLAMAEKESP